MSLHDRMMPLRLLQRCPAVLRASAACALVLALAACGPDESIDVPTVPPSTSTPTPTIAVGFAVQATRIPVKPPQPTATPVITSPTVTLNVYSGSPIQRTLSVTGRRFPANSPVQVSWAPVGSATTYTTTWTRAGASGHFYTRLSVPPSSPGWYAVTAAARGRHGYVRSWHTFHVVLKAAITVHPRSEGSHTALRISGHGFVPYSELDLFVRPLGSRHTKLGVLHVNGHGMFAIEPRIERLHPGQYAIELRNVSGAAWQDAQAFFNLMS